MSVATYGWTPGARRPTPNVEGSAVPLGGQQDPNEGAVEVEPPRFAVKLRLSISTLFLCLILPSFAVFLSYIYRTNYNIYKQNAATLINNHNEHTSSKLVALLDPIGDSLLAISKQVRDDPRLFDNPKFHSTLLLHLENNPNLVSIFVASERGSFHQAQSMRPGMVVANRVAPPGAKYNFWVVDRSTAPLAPTRTAESSKTARPVDAAKAPVRAPSVFTFHAADGTVLDTFSVDNNYDPRERPFYKALSTRVGTSSNIERKGFVYIGEPYIASSTRQPTINVSAPVFAEGRFQGMVGESFELSAISSFLRSIQISRNCETYILDTEGNIVVSTGPNFGYRLEGTNLIKQNALQAAGQAVEDAVQIRHRTSNRQFEFVNTTRNEVYLAHFTPFPNKFNKNWEVLTLAPVSDFMVGLNEINMRLVVYGGLGCLLLVLLTFILSRTISRPIELLTKDIRYLMAFDGRRHVIRSRIQEISILSNAVNKLRNTLRAFTSYVPRDLVNDLLSSGAAIRPGGESRYLTIMFTDLQGFSTISEVTPSRTLLNCVSAYLSLVTNAVKEELGTVDKFIGDSVMAFWGAPLLNQDHAYHACVTAVKSQRRMVGLNQELMKQGMPPLVVRIGIHSDAVLVGNIGSLERMSYTVMGDGVNIAARLEGINKEFATSICISHSTFKEAGERLWTRPVDVITVKGRKGEIPIYELVGIRGGDPETEATETQQALCAATQTAFTLYAHGEYAAAAKAYQEVIDTYEDTVSAIMKAKCLTHLAPQGELPAPEA